MKENLDLTTEQVLKLNEIRKKADPKTEEVFYSIVDFIRAVGASDNPSAYWRKLKERLKTEGIQLSEFCHGKSDSNNFDADRLAVTNCHAKSDRKNNLVKRFQFSSSGGGKHYTDCATLENLFRIVQSIPSPKVEPIKRFLAKAGEQFIKEAADPQLAIKRGIDNYKRKGYSDNWIQQRIIGIAGRNRLTSEFKASGFTEGWQYGKATDVLHKGTFGITTGSHKELKSLEKKDKLRDHFTFREQLFNSLSEDIAAEKIRKQAPKGYKKTEAILKEAGSIARESREVTEKRLGESIVSKSNAKGLESKKIKDNKI